MENNQSIVANEIINNVYTKAVKPLIVEKENYAYIKDPVFGIERNRVVAEVLKTIVRLNLEQDEKIILKFCYFLEKNQNKNGSWNEIHPNYNQPSTLITSIVGEALIMAYNRFSSDRLEESIHNAKKYVLSNEPAPGYFIKSIHYTADHLNVDATCGAFLAAYGEKFSDKISIEIAKQVAKHICEYQLTDGSFPYTVNKGNYKYIFDIPCIHYQGVILFYLSKIDRVIKEEWLKNNLKSGVKWLFNVQRNDGRFDWSKSGLMFSYYLSGAYAFAFSSFIYATQWDKKYLENSNLCLNMLKRNTHGLFLRWEKASWITFPLSSGTVVLTALMGRYPLKHKLFKFGYGLYRQIARRRIFDQIDERFFKNLTEILKVDSSTIEPFNNYPDLFMTSEVLDCLSSSLLTLRGDLDII
jgi:hypothetical protein